MTDQKMSKQSVNIGVDVGKSTLDIHIHEREIFWQDENTTDGIKRILKRLSHFKIARLMMGATGRSPGKLG